MRNTTLCYIEHDGSYLMLHRTKKKNDINKEKWIGIGGGFLENESPEECMRREALEETGLMLGELKLRSVITFEVAGCECEHIFLFKCTDFHGELTDCDEGTLEWVPKEQIYSLNLWEGDKIFLRKLDTDSAFFTLKLVYDADGNLISACENGSNELI